MIHDQIRIHSTASPRGDIDITVTLVNHIENIKRHKPAIRRELFDKIVYIALEVGSLLLYKNEITPHGFSFYKQNRTK